MCCCGQPTINGQPGYRWQPNDPPCIRSVAPPALAEGDTLIHDEPGRCGGIDAHSHHFRFVKSRGGYAVLVEHGGGNERFGLGCLGRLIAPSLALLDSNARYWMLHAIYSAASDAERAAHDATNGTWRQAAAEKRIKTRRLPRRGVVKVWIEPSSRGVPA